MSFNRLNAVSYTHLDVYKRQTQGDGDGIGIVDAHGYHRERYHQTDDEISGEEGKQLSLIHIYFYLYLVYKCTHKYGFLLSGKALAEPIRCV